MAEFVLKYADSRGEIHRQVVEAASERELRNQFTEQGYLVYSVRPRGGLMPLVGGGRGRREKLDLEKFLIFNQQFVTLIRAGLPILKALDLLADRLTDAKLGRHIRNVRDEVKNGALLSEAFRRQGVFLPIYVTSVLAGEKSGSLAEVIDRFLAYQKMVLAVRKKLMVSLLYPAVLMVLVVCLMIFLVTYVVPNFAQLYSTMSANLPPLTQFLIEVGTAARKYILVLAVGLAGGRAGAPVLVAERVGSAHAGPDEVPGADSGAHLDHVPGGAIRAGPEHAAGGGHSADAGARDGVGVDVEHADSQVARQNEEDG